MQLLRALVFAKSAIRISQSTCPAPGSLSAALELADAKGKILCLLIVDRLVEGWVSGYRGASLPPQIQTFAGSAQQLECSLANCPGWLLFIEHFGLLSLA